MASRYLFKVPNLVCHSFFLSSRSVASPCPKGFPKYQVSSLVCGLSALDISRKYSSSKGKLNLHVKDDETGYALTHLGCLLL